MTREGPGGWAGAFRTILGGTVAVTTGARASPHVALLIGRFLAIAGGTAQMQRNAIGERVLGLPREPSFDSTKPFRDVVRDATNWSGRVS
jgi:hypothetical protein